MHKPISKFASDERGATGIEYGLVVGLVALAIAGAAPRLAPAAASSLAAVNGAFSPAFSVRSDTAGAPELKSRRFVN